MFPASVSVLLDGKPRGRGLKGPGPQKCGYRLRQVSEAYYSQFVCGELVARRLAPRLRCLPAWRLATGESHVRVLCSTAVLSGTTQRAARERSAGRVV